MWSFWYSMHDTATPFRHRHSELSLDMTVV